VIRKEVQEEAELILFEGGEIPEVAYWNAWFFLTSSPPEGLGLCLNAEEERYLKEAVCRRYLTIIRRDLTPENIGLLKKHLQCLGVDEKLIQSITVENANEKMFEDIRKHFRHLR